MSPLHGEELECQRKRGNVADTHAIERELPLARKISPVCLSPRLQLPSEVRGSAIMCLGCREELSDLPGSETPLTGFR